MSDPIDYDELRQNIKNGAVYPELLAMAHVIRFVDSQNNVCGDKITSTFKPLLRPNAHVGNKRPHKIN